MGGMARLGLVVVAVGASVFACKQSPREPSSRFLAPGDSTIELVRGASKRSFIVHLPPSFSTRGPMPVLIAYHGGGGNARHLQRTAGLDAKADAAGAVVVYPNGSGRFGKRFLTWNAGTCCGYAMEQKVDDVGFTLAILADLDRDLALDRTRVWATGHSNGAMMAYRLAADAASRVAAIAPVAGADMTADFAPAAPVAVLHVHSVDDPRAIYAGGPGPRPGGAGTPIEHRSVEAGLARWRERDACTGAGRASDTRELEQHKAVLIDYGPCAAGTDVAHWKLEGPGHGWPGSETKRLAKLLGPGTKVISAADEVFRFVTRFSRPDAPELRSR